MQHNQNNNNPNNYQKTQVVYRTKQSNLSMVLGIIVFIINIAMFALPFIISHYIKDVTSTWIDTNQPTGVIGSIIGLSYKTAPYQAVISLILSIGFFIKKQFMRAIKLMFALLSIWVVYVVVMGVVEYMKTK